MGSLLEFSNDVDFIGIPASASSSGKFELLFTNEKGNGVIHVLEQPRGFNYNLLPLEVENGEEKIIINDVSILENMELEQYIKNESIDEKSNIIKTSENKNSIGKIVAMAISPLFEQIALYNNEGNIYLFSSKFDKKRKEGKF